MRLVRLLPDRVQALAPEALRFGTVGLGNTVLYFAIFNLAMSIGAVKATVIATVITTTLSYLANRHWTYRSRPKSALRREYILFFACNLVGMIIQSGVVGLGKYGLGLNESRDRIAFNIATCLGIGLATAFRFWAYRTLVFAPAQHGATSEPASPAAAVSTAVAAAVSTGAAVAPHPRSGDAVLDLALIDGDIDAEIDAVIDEELDAAIDGELAAELAGADAGGPAHHHPS
jgi:putative flippase GtrA